jgi:site-specific DNA-methyltransferase (adenine-specific)
MGKVAKLRTGNALVDPKQVAKAAQNQSKHQKAAEYLKKTGAKFDEYFPVMADARRYEWQAGKMLQALGKSKGGDARHAAAIVAGASPYTEALRLSGTKERTAQRWQECAVLSDVEVEEWIISHERRRDDPTSNDLRRIARKKKPPKPKHYKALSGVDTPFVCGDFRKVMNDVKDDSVSLIFTDPPYDQSSIQLYEDLAIQAARVLQPGGSIVAYCGTYALPQVLNLMDVEGLRFWWMFAVKHERATRFPGKFVFVEWKPMVWFVKGVKKSRNYISDFIHSKKPDKSTHDWAQSNVEASYVIEHLTNRKDLIVDPMCGTGTTCFSAHELGRKTLGIELDKGHYNRAVKKWKKSYAKS